MTRSDVHAVLLPARPLRLLGGLLVAIGLVLPAGVLVWPETAEDTDQTQMGASLRPEMVILPAGSFMMGSPDDEVDRFDDETLHPVTFTRQFALARTEVTQGQYFAVTGERPVEDRQDLTGDACRTAGVGDGLPVDWLDAIRYSNRLSEMENLGQVYDIRGDDVVWSDGDGYRLPTEAEWEYAARAGLDTIYVGTNDPARACDYGNVLDQSAREEYPDIDPFPCSDRHVRLAPVDDKITRENPWRLRGLGGNAAEWVWDWFGPYDPESRDLTGPKGGGVRVIRGGSWWNVPRNARVAYRLRYVPSYRIDFVGFRVARSWRSDLLPSSRLPSETPVPNLAEP